MQYFSFSVCLKTLSIMSSKFTHVVAKERIYFFFKTDNFLLSIYNVYIHPSITHVSYPFFCSQPLRLFPYLGFVKDASMNRWVERYLLEILSLFPLVCILTSGIAELYSSSILNFLSSPYCLPCGCTSLYFHQHLEELPFLHILTDFYVLSVQ